MSEIHLKVVITDLGDISDAEVNRLAETIEDGINETLACRYDIGPKADVSIEYE